MINLPQTEERSFKGGHLPNVIDGVQIRTLKAIDNGGLEIRELGDGSRLLVGTAIVFNSLSESFGAAENGKDFREKILPEAVDGCLEADIRALYNHDTANVLGRTKAGTLKLVKTSYGVNFELRLLDTTLANDLIKNVRAGNIDGCSFGFTMAGWGNEYAMLEETDKQLIRVIKKIRSIHEISVVTFPAYPSTSVSARALSEDNPDLKDFLTNKQSDRKVNFGESVDNLSLLQRRLEIQKNKIKIWSKIY